MEEIKQHLSETWFAWMGGFGDNDVFYYKVHSPVLLVEFDMHKGVFLDNDEPEKFHIHAMVRTVAVGMPVTQHPPHRSRRAALPHRAPALGRNAQALRGIRMHNLGFWKPPCCEWIPPLPGHAMTLAAPS
jgi:uncharacterized protein DUF3500